MEKVGNFLVTNAWEPWNLLNQQKINTYDWPYIELSENCSPSALIYSKRSLLEPIISFNNRPKNESVLDCVLNFTKILLNFFLS